MADTDIDINSTTRGFLLRMGNAWIEQGELRQAIDVYLKITEQYPNSDESKAAKAALLTIAQRYEQEGAITVVFRCS